MNENCCGPEGRCAGPFNTPEMSPVEETVVCPDSCCNGNRDGENKDKNDPDTDCESIPGEELPVPADPASGTPECCSGKVGPCCDSSCLDRLAVRECEADAAAGGVDHRTGGCTGAADGRACSQHSLSALDRYGATLRALGCLCRTLIVRGQETCCEIRERHSLNASPNPDKSAAAFSTGSLPRVRASLDSCSSNRCVTKEDAAINRLRMRRGFKSSTSSSEKQIQAGCQGSCCSEDEGIEEAACGTKCSDPCCSPGRKLSLKFVETNAPGMESGIGQQAKTQKLCADSCCSKDKAKATATTDKCGGGCCGETTTADNNGLVVPSADGVNSSGCSSTGDACCSTRNQSTQELPKLACASSCCAEQPQKMRKARSSIAMPGRSLDMGKASVSATADVENQAMGKEHVVLSISGMTCTGCETKLNKTLATVAGITELKTSLVLSRAEFNINLQLGTVEEVLKHLERTTEFKCEKINTRGSHIDLVFTDESSKYITQKWPDGVLDMASVDKRTMRVVFDPKIVGARDLVEKCWSPPAQLAPLRGDPSLEAGSRHVRLIGFLTLLSAILTIPVLVMAWAPLPENEVPYSSASLALATIVQVVIAGPFYPKALKALVFSGVIEMDLLIVLSTSAAYIFSVVSFGFLITGRPLSTGQFFETSTLLVTLIMVGRWVAALARQKAVEAISIRSLQASTAVLIDEEGGAEREIDVRLLQYGDSFKVLPDTKISTDGTVLSGSSEVNESMLTGESTPVEKHPKSAVIAGSINGPGVMTVRLSRLPSENTVNVIAAMVDEAKLSKPKLQDLADRVASYFVPVVIALTVITFVTWIAVGMRVRAYGGSEATINAVTYAITVLIVSCPCAIGLAVPMVVVIASGVAAENGIIFKSAQAIEVAHRTSHVVFDKTGTLTRGKLSVVAADCVEEDKLPLLFGLIKDNRHPVSVAIAAHLAGMGLAASDVAEPMSLTGKGVETTFGGQKLQAGNARWLNFSDHGAVRPMLDQGYTVFCFAVDQTLKAVYGLKDKVRPDAAATVATLKDKGISVHVVSGDDDGAVHALASMLGIPRHNVRSRSSPAAKKDYIKMLAETGTDGDVPIIVFCGDGTNDAVALAQATIGVHMNEGTDVARSAADVVLMRPSLGGLITMMSASRKSVNRIKFNFAWSFVYNLFAVLLAAGAFVNARIPPEYAGLGELVSVLPVIVAAVLLRWSKM